MPDLSREAVNIFWCEYDRRTLYRIVTSMEQVENWTLDDITEIDQALSVLGDTLDAHPEAEVEDMDNLIKILANVFSARALRIMQYLDSVKPGTASKILMHAEEVTKDEANANPFARLFLKRNLVFERLQLLARVFAPERVNLVIRALEKENE
ncbi:MAG: phosphoesterase [Legionellales bacterium]|nr:phosphoesterase [Legionellales bacterium]